MKFGDRFVILHFQNKNSKFLAICIISMVGVYILDLKLKKHKKKTHYFFCRRYQNCSSAATILSKTVSKIKKSFFFHFLFLRPSVEDEATNLDLVKPPKWSPVRPPNSHRSDPQTEKKMSNFWRAVRPLSNPILIKIVTADLQIRIKV